MAGNVKYLVFGSDGEILDSNKVEVLNKSLLGGFCEIEFGFGIDLVFKDFNAHLVGGGQLILPGIRARTSYFGVGCQNYSFHAVRVGEKHYAAIVYHDCFKDIGYHFFYDWHKFFLPEKEPKCCCKANFNKVLLPYANKVRRSMCSHFNLDDVYGKDVLTKDLRITSRYRNRKPQGGSK